jgi:hypothetical protein
MPASIGEEQPPKVSIIQIAMLKELDNIEIGP